MRVVRMWCVIVGAWAACASLQAQAPAGATGLCKDGTYSNAASKDGACRGHKGVQTWYAAAGTAKPGAQAASSKPAATPQAVAPQAAAPARPTPKAASVAPAQGPAPAGATGVCKDGTYSNAASKDGACRGHKGVQTWYAAGAAPARGGAVGAAPAAPAPVTPRATPQAQPQAQPQTAQSQPAPRPAPARTQAAPGGGNGQVWVNTETKVYHCSGDRYYGKTKQGAYMSEGDAQAKGFRADAGKPCPK